MFGLVLIDVNHGTGEYLRETGLPIYHSVSVLEGLLRGLLLGFINFIAISFFVDQAIRKKPIVVNITKSFTQSFFLEEKPHEWEVYAHFTASLNAAVYFSTSIIALLLTPCALNLNFIILTFGLGSVMSLSTWMHVFFHHYPLDQFYSIERLKAEHGTWRELTRQFIFVGLATATGLVIYGVVYWIVTMPSAISSSPPVQLVLFSLAVVCLYIYVGYFLGVISPMLIFLGKIGERIEEIDKSKNKHMINKLER